MTIVSTRDNRPVWVDMAPKPDHVGTGVLLRALDVFESDRPPSPRTRVEGSLTRVVIELSPNDIARATVTVRCDDGEERDVEVNLYEFHAAGLACYLDGGRTVDGSARVRNRLVGLES